VEKGVDDGVGGGVGVGVGEGLGDGEGLGVGAGVASVIVMLPSPAVTPSISSPVGSARVRIVASRGYVPVKGPAVNVTVPSCIAPVSPLVSAPANRTRPDDWYQQRPASIAVHEAYVRFAGSNATSTVQMPIPSPGPPFAVPSSAVALAVSATVALVPGPTIADPMPRLLAPALAEGISVKPRAVTIKMAKTVTTASNAIRMTTPSWPASQ